MKNIEQKGRFLLYRVSQISAGHSREDIDHAVRAFGEVKKEMGL